MAKTVIGNLSVVLSAQTSSFAKAMNVAGAAVTKLTKVTSLATGLIGVAFGGSLAVAVNRQFEAIDATAKLSDQTGFLVQELQALNMGAKLSGVEVNVMQKALQKMAVSIDMAKKGTGAAAQGFERLGIDVERFVGLRPQAQLELIADALARVNDPGTRQALAASIFGEEGGPKMLRMLSGGAAGLREFQKEAERAGLTINRMDANQIEQMNDAFERLRTTAAGFAQRVAVWVAPGIQLLVEKMNVFGQTGTSAIAQMSGSFKSLGDVIVTISALIDQIGFDATMQFSKLADMWLDIAVKVTGMLNKNLQNGLIGLQNAGRIGREQIERTGPTSDRTRELQDRLDQITIDAFRKQFENESRLRPFELPDLAETAEDRADRVRSADFAQVRLGRIAGGVSAKPVTVEEKNSKDVVRELRKSTELQQRLLDKMPFPGVLTA